MSRPVLDAERDDDPVPFFEPPPPPPDRPPARPRRPRWLGPPDGVIGEVAPLRAVLVRSESMIIVADRFVCYPSGFEFHLAVRMSGALPGPLLMMHGAHAVRGGTAQGAPDDALHFGIAFADGRKATNLSPRPFGGPGCGVTTTSTRVSGTGGQPGQPQPEPQPPLLTAHGGSASDNRWDQNCWLWGLPPEGPMGVVVQWAAQQIEETRVDIDAAMILEAAGRAEVVWDD